MSVFDLPVLAQVNPDDLQVTNGQAAAALMTLGMLVASLCMVGIWISRYLKRDCCLTSADRGVLRCPPAVTVVAVVLTALMGILGLAGSMAPAAGAVSDPTAEASDAVEEVVNVDGVPGAAAFSLSIITDEDESRTPEQEDPEGDEAVATEGDELSLQEKFRSGIQMTLVLDLFLLAIFGSVIWVNRVRGAAALPEDLAATEPREIAASTAENVLAHNPWPDLDVAAARPLVETGRFEEASPFSGEAVADLYRPPADAGSVAADLESSMPSAVAGGPPPVHTGTEAVTLLGELRYAFEVFLVALAPTTLLRLAIAYLYMTLSGTDEIPQHPFLELMQDGIDTPMLVTIAFMAIVMAPLMEELLYRVVILGGMAQAGWPLTGLWLSSILFGIAHGFPDCLALLPLAFLLGYTYLRRRSYLTVILVHFLFNAFNLTVAGLALF